MGRLESRTRPAQLFHAERLRAALLVNNVYRDIYGSPFHRDWVWSTRSRMPYLWMVQARSLTRLTWRPHSQVGLQNGLDYVAGDATAAYEGRLKRFWRHIFFVKPDVIVIADEVEAARPSAFEWMLHAQAEFQLDEARQRLTLDRGAAGVIVDYASERP